MFSENSRFLGRRFSKKNSLKIGVIVNGKKNVLKTNVWFLSTIIGQYIPKKILLQTHNF